MYPSKQVSRTPPKSVRLQLRKEVGFGCPICGSPHLEYHHFDPPWAVEQHHNPRGMIALCQRHHDDADTGAFTKEQLYKLKSSANQSVRSKFNWRRKHTVFSCGSNYAYECGSMLTALGIDLIYFEKDEDGFDTLSLNIYDTCLNPIAIMRQNDWLARSNVDEIEAPPRSPRVRILSRIHRVSIEIEFKDRNQMSAKELDVLNMVGVPLDEEALVVKLTGEIPAPCHAKFTDDALILNENIKFSDSIVSHCSKAILLR